MKSRNRASIAHLIRRRVLPAQVLVLVLLASGQVARSQVFELGGGSSSLFQASGGSVEVHAQNYQGWFGIGSLGGHLRLGASLSEQWHGSTFTFGDEIIPFHLPSDVFEDGHYFAGRGVGVSRSTERLSLLAFGGVTTTGFNVPLFRAASAENGAGALFIDFKLLPKLHLFSRNIISNRQTTINGAEWQPWTWLKTSVSGGVGANQGYFASGVSAERPWITVKGAYIAAGDRFRRVVVETPLNSEPDRENILVTLRPKPFLDFTAGHLNFLEPAPGAQQGIRATVDEFSANATGAGFRLGASLYKSHVNGKHTEGTQFSVGRDFAQRVQANVYLLHSTSQGRPSSTSVLPTVREVISPRFSLLQTVNLSAGNTSVSFGGDFLSNPISIGVQYQTVYSPFQTGNPFRQVLLLSFRFRPFGNFSINASSYVAPDGSVKYTTSGHTFLYRDEPAQNAPQRFGIPAYIISGRVVDEDGNPVSGAALRIDGELTFTNSVGAFFVRRKKARPCHLEVALPDFLVRGAFDVISAPTEVEATKKENENAVLITIRHKKAP
jgi:hypothetical protein